MPLKDKEPASSGQVSGPIPEKDPEVAFLLNGIPVVKFRPEDFIRKPLRSRWSSSTDYIFVSLAFVIGFGNLQFPYLCHKNGGAIFLIPYFLAIFLVAIPMLVLEAVLGHLMQRGCLTAWNLTPIFKGVGIASTIMLIWRNAYYIIISIWAGYFALHLFRDELPYRNCGHDWNSPYCRQAEYACVRLNDTLVYFNKSMGHNLTAVETASLVKENVTACELVQQPVEDFFRQKILQISESIEHIGDFRFILAIGLAIVYGVILMCVLSGIKLLGKLVYPIFLLPFCIMIVMLLRSFGLPGVFSEVFRFYIKPDFMKLLTFSIWIEAFENVLYTFGPGLGVFIALGSYNRNNVHVIRQTIIVCVISGVTSFLLGFMIFAYIGHASYVENAGRYFRELITDDLSLIFAAFPVAMLSMKVPSAIIIWTFLFFVMVFFLGLSTQIVAVEALLTALVDASTCVKYTFVKRFFLSFIVCGFLGGLGLFFLTNNGIYLYKLFRYNAASGYPAIFVCLMECIVIGWAFGTTELFKKTKFYLKYVPFFIWRILWIVVTPALLLAALVIEIINHVPLAYDSKYKPWSNGYRFSYLPYWSEYIFIGVIIASSILWIFIYLSCYLCCKRCKCTKEAVRADYNIREGKAHEKVPLIKITEVVKPTKPSDV